MFNVDYDVLIVDRIIRGLASAVDDGTYIDKGIHLVGDSRWAEIAIDGTAGLSVRIWREVDK